MSASIAWILEVAIHPGKLEDFKAVSHDLIEATRSEPGTLAYEWHLNETGTVCHIYEHYRDCDAVVAHVQSFGNYAERFMAACRPTQFFIYGPANEAVKAGLADFNPTYFSMLGGFHR